MQPIQIFEDIFEEIRAEDRTRINKCLATSHCPKTSEEVITCCGSGSIIEFSEILAMTDPGEKRRLAISLATTLIRMAHCMGGGR